MAVVTIDAVTDLEPDPDRARAWCRQLEAGDILFFPQSPVPIPPEDLSFLLGRQQTGSKLHKNIAYKPDLDRVSGLDAASAGGEDFKRLQAVMRQYSQDVAGFITRFLSPYRGHWRLDYASFRPQEEKSRDLPLRRRNDLLHTDAFPTRPTSGARILRFFNNINPQDTRDWVVTDPFPLLVSRFAPQEIALPARGSSAARAFRSLANTAGLGTILPGLKRSPYDEFMMRFHNFLKENAAFQANCRKDYVQFPPGSSWMVYTETVPHAVLSGQYALEQTFLVDHRAMVSPESSPLAVLEAMTKTSLV
ncbi:MAG: Kdo hydroxylase family protein [Acidobacteriaceae bacterium]